ncbi:hypothetical protein [Leptodesmis sichuanensis]|uniref:hypothetical protein n=1 Tax=Leptodesmis sichuanensis TaxID=2906798 RepID=UPI001F1B15C3|nr:hypothetical protein [Leptodesmis sichuanensis]UIE36161.1 hypothetical protein KIK02_13850 [Leptodesmis sichuanensis A121]
MGQAVVSRSQKAESQLSKRKKAPKATVSVQVFKGRLRSNQAIAKRVLIPDCQIDKCGIVDQLCFP